MPRRRYGSQELVTPRWECFLQRPAFESSLPVSHDTRAFHVGVRPCAFALPMGGGSTCSTFFAEVPVSRGRKRGRVWRSGRVAKFHLMQALDD